MRVGEEVYAKHLGLWSAGKVVEVNQKENTVKVKFSRNDCVWISQKEAEVKNPVVYDEEEEDDGVAEYSYDNRR